MKISVGICAYNAEKTIGRTIESVLAQTYPDFEIVVVNDGSTDGTLAIVEKYARENPGKFQIKTIPNGGLANARNVGIEQITGQLFMSLDADDYLESFVLEKAAEAFARDAEVDVCFFGLKIFDENGSFYSREQVVKTFSMAAFPEETLTGPEAFEQRIYRRIWIQPGSAVYRTSLFKGKIWNHPGKNQGEDMYFILSCLLAARKVACVPEDGFCYMMRSDSMNHMSFNEGFFAITDLLAILTEDVKRLYPERAEKLLPMVAAEEAVQRLAIIKRMARSMGLRDYGKQKKRVWDAACRKRCFTGWKWLSTQKRIELAVCAVSGTCYYAMTKLVSR